MRGSKLSASLILASALYASGAAAEEPRSHHCGPLPETAIEGQAWAIDGGSMAFVASSGRRFAMRLWAIDAPPLRDAATRLENPPGLRARVSLDDQLRTAGRRATCIPKGWDRACRLVAICEAGGNDLSVRMLAVGYAVLRTHEAMGSTEFDRGRTYAETEEVARASRAGQWQGWLGPKAP
ncbi:MAG: thermonuclease family protein [Alphaproteobacteria bacterium]|nr:thermonuclease family protein [Alphaproteobacteria bacterium]